MKIKEFAIRRYGPLADTGRIRLDNFNLFWGENEEGKTLTLEALISLLLGKGRKIFPGIERVAEQPDGYVIFEDGAGREYKLPEMGLITDFMSVSPEEYRNIFIIRNTDLTIDSETQFYGSVTERLTGLRTFQILNVKNQLRSLGYFTDKLDTVNTKESRHLKTRLSNARELIEQCAELTQWAQREGYDTIEENLVYLQQTSRELEREMDNLEKARLREKLQTGSQQLKNLQSVVQQLESLNEITEEELSEWKQAKLVMEEKEAEKEQLNEQYKNYEAELAEEEKRLRESSNIVKTQQERQKKIDESLKPMLHQLANFKEYYARVSASRKFFGGLLITSLLISLITLGGMYMNPQPLMMLGALASGTITLGLALFYYFRFIQPNGKRQQLEQQIVHQASELGLAENELTEIQKHIQRLEEDFERQQQLMSGIEGKIEFYKKSCKSLREERFPELDQRLKTAWQKIQHIQAKHNIDFVDVYQEKLQERKQCEQQLKDSVTMLKSLFGSASENLSECIQQWKSEIQDLEIYQDTAPGVIYDEKILIQKREEQKEVQQKIEATKRSLREFRELLNDLERRANEILLPENEFIPCRSVNDLQILQNQLQQFIDEVDHQQYQVRICLRIFEEIEQEEKQKVSTLFGDDSNISYFFNEITDGLYNGVYYNSEDGCIEVKRRDGKVLPPNWLSGGAYDQLYMAIRLSLGKKILNRDNGLFILDDPFLKADMQRLKRQMEVLLMIAQQGWQIIYFSAKDEIKNVLQKFINKKQVVKQPLPGVLFKEEQLISKLDSSS